MFANLSIISLHHGKVKKYQKPFKNRPAAGHLCQPGVIVALRPVLGVVLVGDREYTDLVALPVQLLDRGVVGVLVRHKERCFRSAAVWIQSFTCMGKYDLIKLCIKVMK